MLGEIYEQFLGDVITVNGETVEIVNKPEVRESGGVVPTPGFIAEAIVDRAIGPAIIGKSPAELDGFTVADICCGSGIFLLAAYGVLLDYYLSWYLENDRETYIGSHIYEAGAGQWRLTFDEKRRILLEHLRGVDIDPNAVEVAQFSLLLKLIEDESAEALKAFVEGRKTPALPSLDDMIRCGNSLVSTAEWEAAYGRISSAIREKVNPFSWGEEFRDEMGCGGFNVIVGNPPYIRIQNMVAYSPEEVTFYQNQNSPFRTAQHNNFDKYALFIERCLELVKGAGRVGVIVPHKFMTIQAGRSLRWLLSGGRYVEQVVHFGVKQVFGQGTSNYTCIMVLNRTGCESVQFEKAGTLETWRYGQHGAITDIPAEELTEETWAFSDEEVRILFNRMRDEHPGRLSEVAEILVGVQTSADNIYILHPSDKDADTIMCEWNGREWRIERDILRPCLHDAVLQAYARPEANAWIIYPYELVANAKGRVRAHVIQPDAMAVRYPGCWAYLNARREELEGRNITGGTVAEQQWYQYGRSQSLTKFDTPKIILPVLSVEPRYAYDETNTLFTGGGNGPYYMVRTRDDMTVSNHYLLAVLNHPLSEALVRTNTSTFRGGYYSHGKQFIENLPIPKPEDAAQQEVEGMVAALINLLDEWGAARIRRERVRKEREATALRREIEERMSAVFGLSEEDMETVRAVPVPE